MAKNLSSSELDAEHVELLPARTLVTALLIPVQSSGTGAGVVGALDSAGSQADPPCSDIPWWAPKPPGC
jgi:hypothetical protein